MNDKLGTVPPQSTPGPVSGPKDEGILECEERKRGFSADALNFLLPLPMNCTVAHLPLPCGDSERAALAGLFRVSRPSGRQNQMMITTEQIEAEIGRLEAEMNRRLSEVRGLFADVASLRTQAKLFEKLLEVRGQNGPPVHWVSFLLLGYVGDEPDQPTSLFAVTWTGPREAPSDLRLHLRRGWQALLQADDLLYVSDLLADWQQWLRSRPATFLASLWELSVGPLRAMADGTTQESKAKAMLIDRLGDFETFPNVVEINSAREE